MAALWWWLGIWFAIRLLWLVRKMITFKTMGMVKDMVGIRVTVMVKVRIRKRVRVRVLVIVGEWVMIFFFSFMFIQIG